MLTPRGAAALLSLVASILHAQARPAPEASLAIVNVAGIDATGAAVQQNKTVLIAGDRIVGIVEATASVPKETRIIRGDGKFLIPGLWDMHVHLTERDLPILVAYGVTGVRTFIVSHDGVVYYGRRQKGVRDQDGKVQRPDPTLSRKMDRAYMQVIGNVGDQEQAGGGYRGNHASAMRRDASARNQDAPREQQRVGPSFAAQRAAPHFHSDRGVTAVGRNDCRC